MNAVTVRVTRRFPVPAERVFDTWSDAAEARQFLFRTPTGQMVRCDLDAHSGGHFVITERRDGEDVEHLGEYLEIDRPRRLAFSFKVPKYSAVSTTVVLDIASRADGCELTLTHEGVVPEWAESTRKGWSGILDRLAVVLAGAPS